MANSGIKGIDMKSDSIQLSLVLGIAALLACDKSSAQDYQLQYATKFVCGKGEDRATVPGRYLTAVNLHNPAYASIPFRWKVAVALPKLVQGPISPFSQSRLGEDGASEVTCKDILNQLGPLLPPSGFVSGFVVVETNFELDVVAVYTALDSTGKAISIDVERTSSRATKPPGRPDLTVPNGCVIRQNRIVFATVKNQGAASAQTSTTRFFFTPTDNGQPVGPTTFADVATASLASGASVTISVPIPPLCFQPDCALAVVVDNPNLILEQDESNNTGTGTCIG
jgi:CARDB